MTRANGASTNGNGHTTLWRRYTRRVAEVANFIPFARDAAMDRLRRTGAKAFVRDLPVLVRMGFNYYRWIAPRSGGDDRDAPPPTNPYDAWRAVNRWTPGAERILRNRLAAAGRTLPKISVVMPVHNPPVPYLQAAIASVRNQVYDDWELCIADDKSTDPQVGQVLRQWAERDRRIKLIFRPENGHISRATNTAAELASGDFLLFLDHDDELTADALGEIALYVADHPDTDFVYSDSDKIDVDGRFYDVEFKPDFSPELLLSYMYFTHVCAVRRDLYHKIGGTRPGFEGSQDHDLALRATEQARHVGHVPMVLYHWRAAAGSTATNGAAKPESFIAGRNAVQEAMFRRGMQATVCQPDWAQAGGLGIYSADFPDEGPSVTILIPTKNGLATLKKCLSSLEKTTYRNYQVLIIDNDSDDPATQQFLTQTSHRVLRVSTDGRFNFAALNNRAAEAVDSDLILLLNNDTEVIDGKWLSRMVGYSRATGVGAVGARLLYPDGRVQHAGIIHGIHQGLAGHAFKLAPRWDNGYLSHARLCRNYSAVTAACLLTPRKLFLEQGGLDERQFSVAYNDVDYCYKLVDRGYRCVYVAGAELLHHEGLSRGFGDCPEETAAFRQKYGRRRDPYYSPHLSTDDERFRIQPRRLPRTPVPTIRTCIFSHMLNLTGAPLAQYEATCALARDRVIEPVVACVPDGPLRQWYEKAGAQVHVLGTHPLTPALVRAEAYEPAMNELGRRMKEQWKVDLVYANTLDTAFAVDAASRAGIPVIWNIHESEGWRAFFGRWGMSLAQKCLACFSKPYRVIFPCDATRRVYAAWNSAHNFTTVRNPPDLTRLCQASQAWSRDSARQSLQIEESDLVLLNVGSLCARKGQLDLVQVLSRLPWWLRTRVRCFLVGEQADPYTNQVRHAVAALGAELAKRLTLVDQTSDVARYYKAADVFVCSSRIECYPRVTQEAMAMGLPIVCTPVFGLAEQVRDGTCGIHYWPGNLEQLAGALVKLAADAPLRHTMARRAPLVLKGLGSFEQSVDQFAQICREAYLSGI